MERPSPRGVLTKIDYSNGLGSFDLKPKTPKNNMIYAVGGQGIESNPKKILRHNKNALRNTL
jgi:hypothetical protein